jgi:hypothetical protein
LNNLVAPIALYPDPLLGQVLAASTYPLEIVEASQWLEHNSLTGQALTEAARQQPWDPSVQALVAFPDVLTKLNQDVRWTTDLGNAFLAQQADVMSAVQRMRQRAQSNGRLSSNQQQTVSTQWQDGQQAIAIQPPSQDEIYVPSYDPTYVWGAPAYGYYPPLYYPGYGFYWGRPYRLGFYFGGWGGWGGWGWGPGWFGNSLFVNFGFFNHYGYRHIGYGYGGFGGRGIWAHDGGHRLGVPYGNAAVASRFQSASVASRNSFAANGGRAAMPYRGNTQASPQQSYRAAAPQQSYRSTPQQSYRSASPQQSYRSTPQQSFRSAPSMSIGRGSGNSFSGGGHVSSGGGGGFHGGGGGSGHVSGGGGGGSHGGGGGGGHHR